MLQPGQLQSVIPLLRRRCGTSFASYYSSCCVAPIPQGGSACAEPAAGGSTVTRHVGGSGLKRLAGGCLQSCTRLSAHGHSCTDAWLPTCVQSCGHVAQASPASQMPSPQ